MRGDSMLVLGVGGVLVAVVFGVVLRASAEPARPAHLCTRRDDRPDLGSPVHSKTRSDSLKLQHRLRNGTRVEVLRSATGGWKRIRYVDPGPPVRSEPLRYEGWIRSSYLRSCDTTPPLSRDEMARVLRVLTEQSEGAPVDVLRGGDVGGDMDEIMAEVRGQQVKVCWLNAKRLGHGKTRDWDATARAVRGCDVVGLAEVMTPTAADQLASHMPAGFKALTSDRSVGRSSYREYYAAMYDSGRVQEVEGGTRGFFDDAENDFVREPWAVTLRSGAFDFTMALLHATWGDSEAERVAELEHVDDVWRWFQGQDAREDDIVLLGDFNRTPEQTGWEQVLTAGMKLLCAGLGTTISSKGARVSLYDQVMINPRTTREWTGKAGVVEDVGCGLMQYRSSVSDHLPVWASFGVTGEDDD